MIEYKKIPFFTRYAIARTGEVINYQSLRTVKNVNGRVNLTSDRGDRTTKRPHLMVRELFNQEMENLSFIVPNFKGIFQSLPVEMKLIEKISNNTRSVSLVKIDEGYEVLNKKGVDYDVARFETLVEALNHFNTLAELFETSAPGLQTIN